MFPNNTVQCDKVIQGFSNDFSKGTLLYLSSQALFFSVVVTEYRSSVIAREVSDCNWILSRNKTARSGLLRRRQSK